MWSKLFILTIVFGVCVAAIVTDVEKIKIKNNDEGTDLKTAESTNRQFSHGGYGGYPSGFGGYGNYPASGFGGYGGYGAGWSHGGGYGIGYPHGGGYGHLNQHHHG